MPEEFSKEKENTTSAGKKSDEYIELRIPRFSIIRVPFLGVVGLMLLSFIAGYFANQILAGTKSQAITDLPSAFSYYAKKLKLNENKFAECYTESKYLSSVDADTKDGSAAGVTATPTFFVNGQPLIGALPFDAFKQLIEHELNGTPLPTPDPSGIPTPTESEPAPPQNVAKGHIPSLGNPQAKVTIVEFSDFQCPFCERFFTDTYPLLKKEYIDTGKIVFYFRHFPLSSIHPAAKPAALASECANEQGKFWQFHDFLFQNQAAWVNLPTTTTRFQ